MKKSDKLQTIIFFLATILLIINISLIFQNLNLRAQLTELRPLQVEEGDILNGFQAKDLNGNETKIDFLVDTNKTILLFFDSKCGFCMKQMPYWKNLVSNASHQNYAVIAITTETNVKAIIDFTKKYGIENWKVLIVNSEQAQRSKLLATPVTLVINNKGVVEKAWTGLWPTEELPSIGAYFSIEF